jgi:hypothetical protein
MHTQPLNPHLSAAQLNRLHDQAWREARVLRNAAIDELWNRMKAGLRSGLEVARRAAAKPAPQPRQGRAGAVV